MTTRSRKKIKKILRSRSKRQQKLRKMRKKYGMDNITPCEQFQYNTGSNCPNCCSAHTRCQWMGRNSNPKCRTKSKWVLDSLQREIGDNHSEIVRRFENYYNRQPDGIFNRYPQMDRTDYNNVYTTLLTSRQEPRLSTSRQDPRSSLQRVISSPEITLRTYISELIYTGVIGSFMPNEDDVLRRIIGYARRLNINRTRATEIYREIMDEIFDPQPDTPEPEYEREPVPDYSDFDPDLESEPQDDTIEQRQTQDFMERYEAIKYMERELNIRDDGSEEAEEMIEQIIKARQALRENVTSREPTETLEDSLENLSIGENEPVEDCSICLMSLDSDVYTLPGKKGSGNRMMCQHKFHRNCLKQCWKSLSSLHQRQSSKYKCPVCRTEHPLTERNRLFSDSGSDATGVSAAPTVLGTRGRGTRGRGTRGRGRGTRGRGRARGRGTRGPRGRTRRASDLPPGF